MENTTFTVKDRNTFQENMQTMFVKNVYIKNKPSKINAFLIMVVAYILCFPVSILFSLYFKFAVVDFQTLASLINSIIYLVGVAVFWGIFIEVAFLICLLITVYLVAVLAFFTISRNKIEDCEIIFTEDNIEIRGLLNTQRIMVPYVYINRISKSKNYLYIEALGRISIPLNEIRDPNFILNLIERLNQA